MFSQNQGNGQKKDNQEPLINDQNEIKTRYKYEYEPYAQPPNYQFAYDHQKAMRIGIPMENSLLCSCCNNPIKKENFPLNCTEDTLTFLGCAYPLYFRLSKYFALILLLVFLITNSFSIIKVYQNCGDKCIRFFGIAVIDLDYINKHRTQQTYSMIVVATVITTIMFYLKPYIFKDIEKYSQLIFSTKQYTIMVQNFPQNTTQDEIKAYFKAITKDKIQKVCMAYDISKYVQAKKIKPNLIRQIKDLNFKMQQIILEVDLKRKYQKKILEKKEKLQEMNESIDFFDLDLYKNNNNKFIGTAFVSFNTTQVPQLIIREFGQTFFRELLYFIFCGTTKCPYLKYKKDTIINNLIIKQPADPQDVIWQNLEFSYATALYNNTFMFLALLLILYGSFVLQYLLMFHVYRLKKDLQQDLNSIDDFTHKLKAMLLSLIVVFTNWVLKQLTRKFCELQRYDSKSRYTQTYINMYLLLCFINSAFMPYLVHAQFEKIDLHTDLLIQDILFLLLGNAFTTPITRILDFNILIKWYKRRKIQSYRQHECPYTQKEMNKIFQGRKYDIAESYMYIFRTLFVTVWYSTLAPIGLVFSILGITLNYWVDKVNLLRFYKIPHCYNEEIIKRVINVLELLPLVFVVGAIQYELRISFSNNILEFIFQSIGHSVTSVALFFCGLLYIVLYRQKIPKKKKLDGPYEKQKLEFIMDYDLTNPITAQKAWIERNSFLLKQKNQPQYIKRLYRSERKLTQIFQQQEDYQQNHTHTIWNNKNDVEMQNIKK